MKLRKEVGAAVEKKVSSLMRAGPVREAIMVPWRLDEAGRPPNVGVMSEVEAALGTVLHGCCNTSIRVQEAGVKAEYGCDDNWRQLVWC